MYESYDILYLLICQGTPTCMVPHSLPERELLEVLRTDKKRGLRTANVPELQQQYGQNKLPSAGGISSRLSIFLSQWKSPLIIILMVAGTISGIMHEFVDMGIIYGTSIINIIIGFIQENKANDALKKLQSMVTYSARVLRDGNRVQIDSTALVPGDILFLSAGDRMQADGRLLAAQELLVNEAALTGESEPIKKIVGVQPEDASLGDRINMVYRGTSVMNGEATVLVTATGVDTELGKIATLVQETQEEDTPLQIELGRLSMMLGIVISGIAVGLVVLGLLRGGDNYTLLQLFETAVAVAVAAIPEGMVISLTVVLALGMQQIIKKKSLVRKLVAAETLGSVSVICTDKTGTLTEGVMRTTRVVTMNEDLEGGEIQLLDPHSPDRHKEALLALRIGLLSNNASLENPNDPPKAWKLFGDTTEIALLEIAERVDMHKAALEDVYHRVAEVPFTSERKYMATLHQGNHERHMYIKGAPDVLLAKTTKAYMSGEEKRLGPAMKKELEAKLDEMTSSGLRVLMICYKDIPRKQETISDSDVGSLVFVGFVGLSDPVRPEVRQTIDAAKGAGIHVAMITGDHKKTAASIAASLGLPHAEDDIFEGKEIEAMDDAALTKAIGRASIFARVDPKHKVRIVQAFQARGDVVSMTGDGVNDAPALKGADIGVALGSGTDIAKETSDLVLLDDSFSTIVAAVEEGRRIYQNIKKVVLYLLSGTFAEVVMIAGSIIAGLPVAALPAQILWINIVEDTFLNIALAFDKGDKENMNDKPRKKGERIIDSEMKIIIVAKSVLSNITLFSIYYYMLKSTNDLTLARTMVFVGFGIDSLFLIFSVRSLRHMIWELNPFGNKILLLFVAYGWAMLITAVHVPAIQFLLKTKPMGVREWGIMLAFGLGNMALIEIVKYIFIIRKTKS